MYRALTDVNVRLIKSYNILIVFKMDLLQSIKGIKNKIREICYKVEEYERQLIEKTRKIKITQIAPIKNSSITGRD